MPESLIVRRATLDDASSVAELMIGLSMEVGVSGYPPPYDTDPRYATLTTEAAHRRMLAMEPVMSVYLAALDGRDVGMITLRLVPYLDQDVPSAEVMDLYVKPEAHRKGVGRALIDVAEQAARERGATVMHILTGADNLDAQAFYRAAGYAMPNVSFEKFLITQPEDVAV